MDSAVPDRSGVPDRNLAQANLLRVRGQLAEAKAALLALLADRPGDRDALDLLARTCEDGGEMEEARRWRALARGPVAESPRSGAEPLLAITPRNAPWNALAVFILIGVVLGLALAISADRRIASTVPTIAGRVEAPGTTSNTPPAVVESPTTGTQGTTITPTPATERPTPSGETRAEARGLARLTAAEEGAPRTLAVAHDPRSDTVTVTFLPRGGEPVRREAATLARTAFATFTTAKTLQMRALRGGALAYLATATRERLSVTEVEGWVSASESNPDALANAILSDEWTAPSDGGDESAAGSATP